MRAFITIFLEHKTRRGHDMVTKYIEGPKSSIVSMVDEFIGQYVQNESLIKARRFVVVIVDSRKKAVDMWTYLPTYR